MYSPVDRAVTSLIFACKEWKDLFRYREFLVNYDARAWERITKWPTALGTQWLGELAHFRFKFGWVYRPGNTDMDRFQPRARNIDDPNGDWGDRVAGQGKSGLQGILYPMDEAEIRRIGIAQQQDAELVALVTWMHGDRPPVDEVRIGSPDLQCYRQLLEYLHLDDTGILRIRPTNPEDPPGGRLVIPLQTDVRKSILEKWHNHESHGHLEGRATARKLTQYCFWPGMELEAVQWSARCKACRREAATGPQTPAPKRRPGTPGKTGKGSLGARWK